MQIISKKPPYQPPVGKLKDYISPDDNIEMLQSAEELNKNGAIFFTPSALTELAEHLEWGKRTSHNVVELMGFMVGRVFFSEKAQTYYAVCESAIPVDTEGNSTYIEASPDLSHETTNKARQKAEELGEDYRIIGWYHTHPNNLDVFMSGTDRKNQNTMFPADWHFAVVLNPQRMIWRAFRGAKLKEVNCVLLCEEGSVFLKKPFENRYDPAERTAPVRKAVIRHGEYISDIESLQNILNEKSAEAIIKSINQNYSFRVPARVFRNICVNGKCRIFKKEKDLEFHTVFVNDVHLHETNAKTNNQRTFSVLIDEPDVPDIIDFTLHNCRTEFFDDEFKDFCDDISRVKDKSAIIICLKRCKLTKIKYFMKVGKREFRGIIDDNHH